MAGAEEPSISNDVVAGRLYVTAASIELDPRNPAQRTLLESELWWFFVVPPRPGQPNRMHYLPPSGSPGTKDVHKLLEGVREHERDTVSFDLAWPRKHPGKARIVMTQAQAHSILQLDASTLWKTLHAEFAGLNGQDVSLKMIYETAMKAISQVADRHQYSQFLRGYWA